MMLRIRHFFIFVIIVLVSCGETKPQVPLSDKEQGGSELPISFAVKANSELPKCNASREGALAYVVSDKKFKVCNGGSWVEAEVTAERGPAGESCVVKKTGPKATIKCGKDEVDIVDGISTAGTACSVSKSGGIAAVTCGENSVTINDGIQGAAGTNGSNGSNGASCSVSKSGSVATVVCDGQAVQVIDGSNGQNCSVSKTGSVATVTCGGASVTLNDGAAGPAGAAGSTGATGAAGAAGSNSLIAVAAEQGPPAFAVGPCLDRLTRHG